MTKTKRPVTTTRRTFAKAIGASLVGTGLARGTSNDDTRNRQRYVVGTDAQYGVNFAVQRSERIEKEIDLGSRGEVVVGQFDEATAEELAEAESVRYVERDVSVTFPESDLAVADTGEASEISADAQHSPWGCDRIGAMSLHAERVSGEGAHVAIIDSGIDSNHPDLQSNLGAGYAVTSCEEDECQKDWGDDHTHGTHCAGIVAALDNGQGVLGISPDVTLHAVKTMTAAGSGSGSDIAEGIVWAADQGFDVANVSLGSDESSDALHDAIKYADENGMLVVSTAGNDGCGDCLHYPGAYDETLCVGAVDDEDELAEFSSTGDAVDLVAPGVDIPSTVVGGEYRAFSGTSMATPHVVGAAALLVDAGYTPSEARDRLLETAEDVGLEAAEAGEGLVNCEAAVSDPEPRLAVETGLVRNVKGDSATLAGELTSFARTDSATVGFEYWPASASSDEATRVETGTVSSADAFEGSISGLDPDTEYEYRAVCTAGEVTATGSPETFVAGVALPQIAVTMESVSDAELLEPTFTAELTMLNGVESVNVDFEYWLEGQRDATVTTTDAVELRSTEAFSQTVAGLELDTTYVVRARVVPADAEPVYTDETRFTTPEEPPLTVEATGADVSLYGGTLQGTVTSFAPSDERVDVGFHYWTDGDGRDSATTLDAGTLTEPGAFEKSLIDLDEGTTYRFVAYADPAGRDAVTSSVRTFTTDGTGF